MSGLYGASRPILVLAPHPDDETFGCGGAIHLFTSAGGEADVAFVTRGEGGGEIFEPLSEARKKEIAEVRTAEGAEACRRLGVKRHWFLDGVDGDVAHSARVAPALATLLQQTKYGRIFCPWAKDNHGDHQATFQWLKHVLGQTHYDCDVWLYEVWRPLQPTLLLPLGNSMDAKIAAIHAHASQLKVMNYLDGFCGLAAYRGLTSPPARFAEAFIVTTSDAIVAGQHG